MNWRPIETAPKDGTYILLAGNSGYMSTPHRVHVGRWKESFNAAFWATHSGDWFTEDGDEPTHWMPLPPPPSTEPAPQDTGEFGEPWQIASEIDGVMAGRNTWIKSSRGKQVAATYNQTRPAAQNRKDECEKYAARITDCVNLLAGHDLSQVVVVPRAVLEELLAAVSDIVKPLVDETETSGNPCCFSSPAQDRRIATALASFNAGGEG